VKKKSRKIQKKYLLYAFRFLYLDYLPSVFASCSKYVRQAQMQLKTIQDDRRQREAYLENCPANMPPTSLPTPTVG
jgi:hypothetical protein